MFRAFTLSYGVGSNHNQSQSRRTPGGGGEDTVGQQCLLRRCRPRTSLCVWGWLCHYTVLVFCSSPPQACLSIRYARCILAVNALVGLRLTTNGQGRTLSCVATLPIRWLQTIKLILAVQSRALLLFVVVCRTRWQSKFPGVVRMAMLFLAIVFSLFGTVGYLAFGTEIQVRQWSRCYGAASQLRVTSA